MLSAAKEEFNKYAGVLDKIKKNLATIQNTVEHASVRTRAINRKLRDVESLEISSTTQIDTETLEIEF